MVFSSAVFVFAFLPIVLIGYYVVQSRYRNALLLVASLLFYAYGEPKFVFVMLASILFNYGFALLIDYSNNRCVRKLVLWCAVLVNLGLLFEYKYIGFAQNIINKLLGGDSIFVACAGTSYWHFFFYLSSAILCFGCVLWSGSRAEKSLSRSAVYFFLSTACCGTDCTVQYHCRTNSKSNGYAGKI